MVVRVVVPPLDGRFDARSHQVAAERDDRFVARSMRQLLARSNVIAPSDMATWGKTIEHRCRFSGSREQLSALSTDDGLCSSCAPRSGVVHVPEGRPMVPLTGGRLWASGHGSPCWGGNQACG